MNLLAEPSLGSDAEAIAHQEHPGQQLGIDGRATSMAIEVCEMSANAVQIDKPINRS